MSRIKFLIIGAFVGLLTACGPTTHEYLDNKDVKVQDVKQSKDGDFIVVTAKLVNDDDDDVTNSVYRVIWFDGDEMPIEQSAWRPIIVKGKVPVYIKERSTVPGAKSFKIMISNDAS